MNRKTRTAFSMCLVVMFLLNVAMAFRIGSVAGVSTTYVAVINNNAKLRDGTDDPNYGTTSFNYTNVEQPPNATGYPLGYLDINITVIDVLELAGWQVNLTYAPTLLQVDKLADISYPADHVFAGLDPKFAGKGFDNTIGYLKYACAIGPESPATNFTGSGTMCQIRLKIIQEPSSLLSCDLFLETDPAQTIITSLRDVDIEPIDFTPQHGYYEYEHIVPPPPKPYLEIYPSSVEQGLPLGPPIIGTPKAFFTVDIVINDVENATNLVGLQTIGLYYPKELIRVVPQEVEPGVFYNATEGPFMNQTWVETNREENSWAPYGTVFFTTYLGEKEIAGHIYEGFYIVCVINSNMTMPAPKNYTWNRFPDTDSLPREQRVVATMTFESIKQEEYPWEDFGDFLILPVFDQYFINSTMGYIEYKSAIPGEYHIRGWILGRYIDVFTQYDYPFGGQDVNMSSDMFEPQKTVVLKAKVTYNDDPVQNKTVTFQIVSPHGDFNFTISAQTNTNGIATVDFGIPWPCENPEEIVFGVWTVVATVDIMCTEVKDWLWFKVYYYVMNLEVTPTEERFRKDNEAYFNITFTTYRLQPEWVLITLVVYDDLGVPVGSISVWVLVGDRDMVWCTEKPYLIPLGVPLPKWAFVGVGKAYVNALSEWPWNCGRAYCPEEMATFTILKYS